MNNNLKCRVCLREKSKNEMRKTIRGRITKHCKGCVGLFRCIYCGQVKKEKHFKTNSGNRQFFFDDGGEQRVSVCYSCDYKANKDRYSRYDKKVAQGKTIRHKILSNFQTWKMKCRKRGWKFNLSSDFLVELWNKQGGKCFYTGEELTLDRLRRIGDSASLDRIDSTRGYTKDNVVWTSRFVNTSKGQRNFDEFISFCRTVVSHLEAKT